MNCRKFDRHTADYVAGRLPHTLMSQMSSHAAACGRCARQEARERRLRAAWMVASGSSSGADLWPRIAARVADEAVLPVRRRVGLVRLAIAAALPAAACLTLWICMRPAPTIVQPAAAAVDEGRVVTLVADMQEMPDPTFDPMVVGSSVAGPSHTDVSVSEDR